MVNVLSLRGGGIRGYSTAILLQELERRINRPLAEVFDLVVGTSVGGILATGISLRLTGEQLCGFFESEGSTIFKARRFAKMLKALGHPRFETSNLLNALNRAFLPETVLAHTFTKLMVTSTRYRGDESKIWKSWKHVDLQASLVAASSAAALTYFEPVIISDFEYGDGGMWANNPAAIAVVEANKLWPGRGVRLIDIACPADKSQFEPSGCGLLGAAPHIANIFISAGEDGMGYIAQHLLNGNGRMVSIQPNLLEASQDIGDASTLNLYRLRKCAEYRLERNVDDICELIGRRVAS